jgi:hypothetical protein
MGVSNLKRIAVTLALASTAIAAPAYATAFGIKSIVIQHDGPADWLQVAEVRAFTTANINVAATSAGALASASSQYSGTGYLAQSGAGNAINGRIGGDYFSANSANWIFHSGSTSSSEFLKITFSSAADLNSLLIYGRTDCCGTRDVYKVSLYDSNGTLVSSYGGLSANNTAHRARINFATNVGVSAVPEPAMWAAMMIGFAAVGGTLRRKDARAPVRRIRYV